MDGQGVVVGSKAPDFKLKDHTGKDWTLKDVVAHSPAILVFYPSDFSPVCTKQFCNYRDALEEFKELDVKIFGISSNSMESHAEFSQKYSIPFVFLSDPDKAVAKAYDCTSVFMLNTVSRAVCIINKKGIILYRYVEPTILTRRKSEELVGILKDLKTHALL
jgi:peroxiredoxin Q/BCP